MFGIWNSLSFFFPVSYSSKSQQNFTEEHRSWKHIKQMKIWRRKAFKVKKKKEKRKRNVFTLLMNASLNWKALHPPSMIILFGNRKRFPGPLRLRSRQWGGWVGGWNTAADKRKKKNTEGEAADNGDESPSKLCSSQWSPECSHRSPECFSSRPSNPSDLREDLLSVGAGKKNTL